MNYIHKGVTYTDTSTEFLVSLGMNEEQIESIQNLLDYEVEVNQSKAKLTRDKGQYAPITVEGLTFDADAVSYEKMKGTIRSWDSLIADAGLSTAGMVVGGKLGWTLADNTVEFVTQAQLQTVVDTVAVRAALLQAEYTAAKA